MPRAEPSAYFLLLEHRVQQVDGVEDALVLLGHALPAAGAAAHAAVELHQAARVLLAGAPQRQRALPRPQPQPRALLPGLPGRSGAVQLHHLRQRGVDGQRGRAAAGQGAELPAQRARHPAPARARARPRPAPGEPRLALALALARPRPPLLVLRRGQALEHAAPAEVVRAERQRHRLLEEGQTHGARQAGLHRGSPRRSGPAPLPRSGRCLQPAGKWNPAAAAGRGTERRGDGWWAREIDKAAFQSELGTAARG